jgi:hypothetical protein
MRPLHQLLNVRWLRLRRRFELVINLRAARVALIYNPQTHTGMFFQLIDSASRSLAVKTIPLPFRDAAEIEGALRPPGR